ncbi:MAG: 30S ribosomal protein S6, partial [Ruminococcaceae bacterium]|nr:30S ribosomal protein S6 [Oscillospiraceae bacterium]
MQKYEAMVVISTKQEEDVVKGLVEKFKGLIEENGTLVSVEEWGKKRLAYMINKETEGYYVLYTFESN